MVKRRRRKYKKRALDYIALPRLPRLDLEPDTKKGIFIVFILALGAVSFLSLFGLAGAMGGYIQQGLIFIFGWGQWMVPVMLLILGVFLYNEEKYEVRGANYLGIFLFSISFQTILHFFITQEKWPAAVDLGRGGGYSGMLIAMAFYKTMGLWASWIVMLCLLVISLMLMFNTTLIGLFGSDSWVAKLFYPLKFILNKIFGKKEDEEDEDEEDEDEEDEEDDDEEDGEEDEDEEGEDEDNEREEEENDEDDEEDDEEGEDEEHKETKKTPEFISADIKEEEELWWQPTNINIKLPLSLLNGKTDKPTSGDIKINKEIIKNTLRHFGIQVEMGEVSVGPTVTQYTFKPLEGVKLSKIINLNNDLALALAAHPIRIEAPIPGKSLVGIEVPNHIKAIVSLKEILLTKAFKKREHNLMIALGKDVSGRAWLDDLSKMPHLLVAGATNSGKSVCLNSIIVSLLYQNNPDDLRFIMVDPKRVELPAYNGIPYLLTPVITEVSKTINALKWCLNEMDRRFEILSESGKKNIQTYNESSGVKMPYVIFIIDELADLMVAAARDIEAGIIRLAQMARAVGIHLILATQRPSVDIITGVIKANMPARIAFSVASGIDSRTILDSLGAEKLLGRGDMLFINSEMSKPGRLQGAFLSETETKKIVRYIKSKGSANYLDNITDRQKVRGIGGVGLEGNSDDDELIADAKEIIISMGKASASFLQRRLSIGYARAARLLDILEEAGIVGPANGSKPREILITKEQYEAGLARGVSGAVLHNREETEVPDDYFTPHLRQEDDENDDEESGDEYEDDELEEEDEEEKDGDDEYKDENEKYQEDKNEYEEEDEGKYFSK